MSAYALEITALHQFFEDWFNGRLEQTEAAFARFATVTAPEFHIIAPSGTITARAELVARLWHAHNSRPGARIWVENVRLCASRDDITIATYEEWQQHGSAPARARLSTAVLVADAAQPNGLAWLHVHETWIIDGGATNQN